MPLYLHENYFTIAAVNQHTDKDNEPLDNLNKSNLAVNPGSAFQSNNTQPEISRLELTIRSFECAYRLD